MTVTSFTKSKSTLKSQNKTWICIFIYFVTPLGPVVFRLSMSVTLFVNRTGQWTKCCACLWHVFWCGMPSLFIELAREILETLLVDYLH